MSDKDMKPRVFEPDEDLLPEAAAAAPPGKASEASSARANAAESLMARVDGDMERHGLAQFETS